MNRVRAELLRGRSFESVFRPARSSDDGLPRYRITGSGVRQWPTDASSTSAIVAMLEANGVEVKQRSMGSPGNCNSYHIDVPFLDGGMHAETGNYWFGEKGAWIHGNRAIAWVAHRLPTRLPGALRRKDPPVLVADLVSAYESTDFVVLSNSEHALRIWQSTPVEIAELLRSRNVESAAVVTAFNPFSVPLTTDVNQVRQLILQTKLDDLGLQWIEAEGRDPLGHWPVEPSLLVFGPQPRELEEILVEFQQHAVVIVTLDEPALLVLHPAHVGRGSAFSDLKSLQRLHQQPDLAD